MRHVENGKRGRTAPMHETCLQDVIGLLALQRKHVKILPNGPRGTNLQGKIGCVLFGWAMFGLGLIAHNEQNVSRSNVKDRNIAPNLFLPDMPYILVTIEVKNMMNFARHLWNPAPCLLN
jgi:hypothetical protein